MIRKFYFYHKIKAMKVYKFGGASVRDAAGIRNLAKIVSSESDNLVIVVSAFGKTTNALEKILKAWLSGDDKFKSLLDELYTGHLSVINALFGQNHEVTGTIEVSFALLREYLLTPPRGKYDFEYDQVVSFGEMWSTIIVSEYLKKDLQDVEWLDIRESLLTDDRYRDSNVLWNESIIRVRQNFDFRRTRIYVTQGFIGGTVAGNTTTLGRE
jgi:aspartate kinase